MARHDPFVDHLQQVTLFAACSRKDLHKLAHLSEDRRVAAGTTIVNEGDDGNEFFVILDGTARVSRQGRKIATLGPGSGFGELALLENAPRNATVVADTDKLLRRLIGNQRWGLPIVIAAVPASTAMDVSMPRR